LATKKQSQSTALFNPQSLISVKPLTDNQAKTLEHWAGNYNLILSGHAGTGKTFLALCLALKALFLNKHEKVVIFRSIVATRNIGFLPGTQAEKEGVYEDTYRHLLSELLPNTPNAYDAMKKQGALEFRSTSFIRGNTINNAVIVVDEFSNQTYHELSSVITRIGKNCRVIFSGDFYQSDLRYDDEKAGVLDFLEVLSHMPEDFKRIDFGIEDIVRSGIVKRFLLSEYNLRKSAA
jgi:predicted ribonuclease YlaK